MRKVALLYGGFAVLLSACGGGGGASGVANVPPAPPPPAPTNTSLTNLQFTETFNTASASQRVQLNSFDEPTSVSSGQAGVGTAVTVRYDAANQNYTVAISQAGINRTDSFAPVNLVSSPQDILLTYDKSSNAGSLVFAIGRPGAGPTNEALSYSTFGFWLRTESAGSGQRIDSSYFAFGVRTPTVDMPTVGSAIYQGSMAGQLIDDIEFNVLTGLVTMTADFASGSWNGQFDGQVDGQSTGTVLGFDFSGAGSISGNSFSGTVTGSNSSYASGMSGPMNGGFFGPNAAEAGGTFRLIGGGFDAIGAFGARRQ